MIPPGEIFVPFFRLGVEHILLGFEHLLFLAALLAVARTWRDIVAVITTFTLAHSLTLALADSWRSQQAVSVLVALAGAAWLGARLWQAFRN